MDRPETVKDLMDRAGHFFVTRGLGMERCECGVVFKFRRIGAFNYPDPESADDHAREAICALLIDWGLRSEHWRTALAFLPRWAGTADELIQSVEAVSSPPIQAR